jgi:hypothetical protein
MQSIQRLLGWNEKNRKNRSAAPGRPWPGKPRASRGWQGSLARAISTVMIVKVLLLAILWFTFVRGQQIPVDARSTAEAFGMLRAPHPSGLASRGERRGQ